MHSMSIEIQATKAQGYNRLGKTISVLEYGSTIAVKQEKCCY